MDTILHLCPENEIEEILKELIKYVDFSKMSDSHLKKMVDIKKIMFENCPKEVMDNTAIVIINQSVNFVNNNFDYYKFTEETLKKICIISKSNMDYILAGLNTHKIPLALMIKIVTTISRNQLSIIKMNSIDFRKLQDQHDQYEDILKSFLFALIFNSQPIEIIDIILKKLKSLNYGDYRFPDLFLYLEFHQINPLLYAAQKGDFVLIKNLIKYGADINYQSIRGWTTLTIANRSGFEKITKYLLDTQKKREKMMDLKKIHEKIEIVQKKIDEFENDLKEFNLKYQ